MDNSGRDVTQRGINLVVVLEVGTRFGAYEIGEQIGAGGMGEVYRATDTELKRDVALKVLPQAFVEDADRLARFRREAEILASLNHSNIAQVYGLERSDGQTAIAMELVEGPTLADRIAEGPIPPDEAMGIALQIVAALEAAHERQIVHRDLKPANVKVRDDGTVKVLDFGISKPVDPQAISGSPVMTTPAVTQTGVILGTAAYMSPEQARGKPVDTRTDIWAFGCVLFEMLTGQPAFGGEDVMLTLARVLANDTDVDSLPGTISPAVRQTIRLCLEKDPRKRIADIRDVRLALEGAFDTGLASPAGKYTRTGARRVWRNAVSIAVGVLLTTGAFLWSPWWDAPQPLERRLRIVSPIEISPLGPFALSPDGRFLVVTAATDSRLWLWRLDTLSAEPLPDSGAAAAPFWSPDSRFVAFSSQGMLKRVDVRGGPSQTILRSGSQGLGGIWTPDDQIIFGDAEGGFSKVAAGGGEPVVVTRVGAGALHHELPALLPDGRHFLYYDHTTAGENSGVYLAAIDSAPDEQPSEPLFLAEADVRFVLEPNSGQGHVLFKRQGNLLAQRFDPDLLELIGDPVPIAGGVRGGSGRIATTADDSLLIYRPDDLSTRAVGLVWVDTDGNEISLEAPERDYSAPRISPDATRIAVGAGGDVWIWDERRNNLTRHSFETGSTPLWSLDGRQVLYARRRAGSIVSKASNGTGNPQLIVSGLVPYAMTADGSLIYGTASVDVHIVASDGNDQPLLNTPYEEKFPALSPDERWLAYQSDESGSAEVYVRPFPDVTTGIWQVSTNGGQEPRWSADGRTLYFRNAASTELLASTIGDGTDFAATRPIRVLDIADYDIHAVPWFSNYDVAADGRFLFMEAASAADSSAESTDLIFVENWLSGIRRREAGN